jgi:hypothetical protein
MSDEPKGTVISLTEFAEDCGKTPLNILRKSIRLQTSAFVRLKGQGTLTIFDKIDGQAIANFMKMDLKNQLWELPDSELEKMMLDTPPWHITSVVPPDIVQEDPKHYQFQFQGETINEDDLFLVVPATNKTENKKTNETKDRAKKIKRQRAGNELHKVFWRAFVAYRKENNIDPEYIAVWQMLLEDFNEHSEKPYERYSYDVNEIIVSINSTELSWTIAKLGKSGSYGVGSLPALLYLLKKNPPQI